MAVVEAVGICDHDCSGGTGDVSLLPSPCSNDYSACISPAFDTITHTHPHKQQRMSDMARESVLKCTLRSGFAVVDRTTHLGRHLEVNRQEISRAMK